MSLEHRINLLTETKPKQGFFGGLKRSLTFKVITYSLAALLSFGVARALTACNDTDYTVKKHQYIDGIDNCEKKSTFYQDADNDGYGNPSVTTQACFAPYYRYVTNNQDCDDNNPNINPGKTEIPYNGLDDDCTTTTFDDDLDQDGYSTLTGTIDCNDGNADIHPNATELCDLVDNQCPGNIGHRMVDEGCLPSGLEGRIAFVSMDAWWSVSNIYVMNPDGSGRTNLTNTPISVRCYTESYGGITGSSSSNPAWSPDGTNLAFSVNVGEVQWWEIYVINSDGSNQRQVSQVCARYAFDGLIPAWSPDGSNIAFGATDTRWGSELGGIFTANVDGSSQTQLTQNDYYLAPPVAWSPDGTNIAFDLNSEIFVVNKDGSNLTNLTNHPASDIRPTWSHDGTKIFFYRWNDPLPGMYTMNPDGTDQTFLADGEYPTLSPDGTKIVFVSGRDGNREIYIMNWDGSNQTNITNNPASDGNPTWSPNGKHIAFVSDRDGRYQIYVMNWDGSNQTNISNSSATDYTPTWSP